MREYNRLRTEWLARPENQWCEVFGHLRATTIHHRFGRAGSLLCDVRYWHALSLDGHIWVDGHRTEAREIGLLGLVGEWNRGPKD